MECTEECYKCESFWNRRGKTLKCKAKLLYSLKTVRWSTLSTGAALEIYAVAYNLHVLSGDGELKRSDPDLNELNNHYSFPSSLAVDETSVLLGATA